VWAAASWKSPARRGSRATKEKLQPIYRKLLAITGRVITQAKRFSSEIASGVKRARGARKRAALQQLKSKIDIMVTRTQQVVRQTKARVLDGNEHFESKLLSVFETSTEVIRKGKASKPTEFGKMVKIQEAENQIVIDFEVYDKKPNDSDLLIPSIETHQARTGRTPHLVAGMPDSTPRRMRPKPTKWASNAFRSRTGPPKAPPAGNIRSSAGSGKVRSGEPDARAESVCSNGGTA
jgi:hypothetical protein